VAEQGQVPGCRQPGWPGAYNEDLFTAGLGGNFRNPAFFQCEVTQVAFDRMNTDGIINVLPVAG